MASYQVTVDGTQAGDIVSVEYGQVEGEDIGEATVEVLNTQTNRNLFASGATVRIKREDPSNPGTFDQEWIGEVAGNPSTSSKNNLTMSVDAESLKSQLEYAKVDRPIIELDTGDAVKKAIQETIDPKTDPEYLTQGENISDWSADTNRFELAGIDKRQLNQFGGDMLYGDVFVGQSGTYHITRDNLTQDQAPGRRIEKVEMRMLVNNSGNVFEGVVELRDYDGVNYQWELDIPAYSGFEFYELPVEEAVMKGDLTTDGSFELRLVAGGDLPEERAFVIDMIRTVPFTTSSRNLSATTNSVEQTGRTITRRPSTSVLEFGNTLATEDGAALFADASGDTHFETAGDTHVPSNLNITDDGSTRVVGEPDVDRDFDVRNRVVVRGQGGLQGSFEDSASIQFYNEEVPKEEPIVDPSIRTNDGIKARARGYLSENAWEDTAMSFTIADADYKDVQIGQSIDVTWGSEDIDGTFIVSSKDTTPEGYVTLGMTGNTTV